VIKLARAGAMVELLDRRKCKTQIEPATATGNCIELRPDARGRQDREPKGPVLFAFTVLEDVLCALPTL
jgi:hypothetical protein